MASVAPLESKTRSEEYPDGLTVQELAARAPDIGLHTKIPVGTKQIPHQQFPILGDVVLSHGERVPSPYHNYGANLGAIWGTGDAEYVKSVIRGPWVPLLDRAGRAHMVLMAVNYRDTCIGPYKEFIISFICLHETKTLNGRFGPVTVYDCMRLMDDKIANPYVYKMWLNKRTPVDYGRELVGVDKYYDPDLEVSFQDNGATDQMTVGCRHVAGERNDPGDGATTGTLVKGKLNFGKALLNMGPLCGLMRAYGMCRVMGMVSDLITDWAIITPPGIMLNGYGVTHNPVTIFKILTNPRFTVVKADNQLEYGGELGPEAIDFTPTLYHYDNNLTFVLLTPHAWVDARTENAADEIAVGDVV